MHKRTKVKNPFPNKLPIFSLLVIVLGLLVGCAENQLLNDPPVTDPEMRVFYGNYDDVWRAIQLSIRKYPVHVNNIELGILETDYIKTEKLFLEPVEGRTKPGMRYKIKIRAIRDAFAPDGRGRPAIKVTCLKVQEIQADFFTGFQPVPSDGLEEKTILYRIGRYLEIDRVLTKVSGQN